VRGKSHPVDMREGPVDMREGPVDMREGPVDMREGPVDARVGRLPCLGRSQDIKNEIEEVRLATVQSVTVGGQGDACTAGGGVSRTHRSCRGRP